MARECGVGLKRGVLVTTLQSNKSREALSAFPARHSRASLGEIKKGKFITCPFK
ncbi:MAG: hypothetical protein JWP37_3667 [Mucilaginibacter sp.]|nr:hypothetical protein [Mucilaginibacter sp.]